MLICISEEIGLHYKYIHNFITCLSTLTEILGSSVYFKLLMKAFSKPYFVDGNMLC